MIDAVAQRAIDIALDGQAAGKQAEKGLSVEASGSED
jgi:hypothetical protein